MYSKLAEFQASLPEAKQAEFRSIIEEDKLVAKVSLQAAVNAPDMASRFLASGVILRRDSWLQTSGFLKDLPFDDQKLFKPRQD